jgi:hypothetical protein
MSLLWIRWVSIIANNVSAIFASVIFFYIDILLVSITSCIFSRYSGYFVLFSVQVSFFYPHDRYIFLICSLFLLPKQSSLSFSANLIFLMPIT